VGRAGVQYENSVEAELEPLSESKVPPPPPPPRTKWTRRVPHLVLIGHAASLTPCKVAVNFKRFNLFGGKISFAAPARARGELDTTYLHDGVIAEGIVAEKALRISRGDKGNLFVLTREMK